jgi:putative peptidoglycan lipid II flippase
MPIQRPFNLTGSNAAVLNVLISAVVALLTYISLALISAKFGSSSGSDAYFFLFSLTSLSSTLITSFLGVAVIPVFVKLRIHDGLEVARDYANGVMRASLLIAVAVSIFAYLFHNSFMQTVSRFSVEKIEINHLTLIQFAPIFFLSVMGEFFRIILLAMSRYTWAASCALFQPMLLVGAILLSSETTSEVVLAFALLISKGAVALLTLVLVRYSCEIRLSLWGNPIPAMRKTISVAGVYGCANFVTATSTFFFDYMASGLQSGVLTSISLAQRISALPITVIVNPILEIARVRFAIAQAAEDGQRIVRLHQELMRSIVYLTIPLAAFMYIFPSEIISTLFQRGKYQAESVSVAAYCLGVFALAIPFVSIFMLNGRTVESYQRLLWPSVLGTFGHFMMMAVTFFLVTQWGFTGVPYARVIMEIAYFFPFGLLTLRYFMTTVNFHHLANSVTIAVSAISVPVICIKCFDIHEYLSIFNSRWAALTSSGFIFFGVCFLLLLVLDSKFRACLKRKIFP